MRLAGRWLGSMLLLFFLGHLTARAETSMAEYEVKGLFVLKFIKYVEWPASATADSPFVVGIVGGDKIADYLKRNADGKTINGRRIQIRSLSPADDPKGCAILFIGAAESARAGEVISTLSMSPVLTVGEDDAFIRNGGMINLTLREGKIQLEVNLKGAKRAGLQISSQLLSVAASVKE